MAKNRRRKRVRRRQIRREQAHQEIAYKYPEPPTTQQRDERIASDFPWEVAALKEVRSVLGHTEQCALILFPSSRRESCNCSKRATA